MTVGATVTPRNPTAFPDWQFETLEIEYDQEARAVWMNYKADAPPCFTPQTLKDMAATRKSLQDLFAWGLTERWPIRYFVICSNKPGVNGLGGDLATFAASIRNKDIDALLAYAHVCVDLIHSLSQGLDLPIVTLSAVHGQCLGGAFEAALASDFILAEETANFGVPEVSFNTFPGMGAVSLLTRRLGSALAQSMISEGRVYSGRELYDLDAIDALARSGDIRKAARNWMLSDGANHWRRRRAIAEARRLCFPTTRAEFMRITELWAECSSRIDDHDLRYMERLVLAQRRRYNTRSVNETGNGSPCRAATLNHACNSKVKP